MNHNQLIEYFAQVIQEIFSKVGNANNLTDDKNAQKLITAVLKSLDTLGIKANEVMPQELEKAYLLAVNGATKELAAQNVKVDKPEPTEILKRKIHLAALKRLVGDTMTDLRSAIRTAQKSAKTTITKALNTVKKEIARGFITGNPNKKVSKRVADEFRKQGLTAFITSDGKKLPLDFYARTVVRTKMKQANVEGATKRYEESGVGLVKINGSSPPCHVCARFRGLVISLTGKHDGFPSILDKGVKLAPYHPNCRCSCSPYVAEYKSKDEIQREKDKWKGFDPDKDVRSISQQKAYKKEQDIRRKTNDLRKQYERMADVLGKENMPKTLGGFRRGKESNSKTWQKLQLAYRQANRELKAE